MKNLSSTNATKFSMYTILSMKIRFIQRRIATTTIKIDNGINASILKDPTIVSVALKNFIILCISTVKSF